MAERKQVEIISKQQGRENLFLDKANELFKKYIDYKVNKEKPGRMNRYIAKLFKQNTFNLAKWAKKVLKNQSKQERHEMDRTTARLDLNHLKRPVSTEQIPSSDQLIYLVSAAAHYLREQRSKKPWLLRKSGNFDSILLKDLEQLIKIYYEGNLDQFLIRSYPSQSKKYK